MDTQDTLPQVGPGLWEETDTPLSSSVAPTWVHFGPVVKEPYQLAQAGVSGPGSARRGVRTAQCQDRGRVLEAPSSGKPLLVSLGPVGQDKCALVGVPGRCVLTGVPQLVGPNRCALTGVP